MNHSIRNGCEWFLLAVLVIRPSLDITTNWLISLGPVSLNPAGILSLSLLAVGAIWFVSLETKDRWSLAGHPLFLLFLVWLAILFPWGIVPVLRHGNARMDAFREWIRLLSWVPLAMMVFHQTVRGEGNRILAALFISLIVPALTGLYQIVFHQGMWVQQAHRIPGTFAHPNPFSFYLVLLLGITFWKCRWSAKRTGWVVLMVLEFSLLLATFSFTGAGMLGVLILGIAWGESRKVRCLILPALFVFALVFIATPTGRQRIQRITQFDRLDEIERTGKETSSFVWRLLNWRFLYRTWKESPWVGYGLNSAPTVNPNRVDHGTGPGQEPHNDYIRFLVDTGSVGEVFFFFWLLGIGWILGKAFRNVHVPPVRHFIWITLALYAAWLAGSANDNLFIATAYQYCLWSIFAVALGWAETNRPNGENLLVS